jgi:hypothetical protein
MVGWKHRSSGTFAADLLGTLAHEGVRLDSVALAAAKMPNDVGEVD